MKPLLVLLCLVFAAPLYAQGDGVIAPVGGFPTKVEAISAGQPVGAPAAVESPYADKLPEDDRGLFRFTLFTSRTCKPCQLFRAEKDQDPLLKAILAWGCYNEIDVNDPTQQDRVREYRVQTVPMLHVQTSEICKDQGPFPWVEVARVEGYQRGGAKQLGEYLARVIDKFYEKHQTVQGGRDSAIQYWQGKTQPAAESCPGPNCPAPEADQPDRGRLFDRPLIPGRPNFLPDPGDLGGQMASGALDALMASPWVRLGLGLAAIVLAMRNRTTLAEWLKRLLAMQPAAAAKTTRKR